MSSTFGKIIKINIFGASHGPFIGMVIEGLPAGLKININEIKNDLNKRHSHNSYSTLRNENDNVDFISGIKNNILTGAPLCYLIKNKDIDSSLYKKGIIRPSHADLTYFLKYKGFNDYEGGGFSSGRLTAVLIVLGTICKQIIKKEKINVVSQIKSIHNVNDRDINTKNLNNDINLLEKNIFSVLDKNKKNLMLKEIIKAKKNKDSVGGMIKTYVFNLNKYLGEPYFDSFESYVSHLLFSIGGIVGVSFGDGFDLINKYGSEVNDQIVLKNKKISFLSNHSGGINGGITNTNIVIINIAIKPTPSISKKQKSIDLVNKKNINLTISGRHDPCIVHRIKAVVNAIINYAILDLLLASKNN